MKCRHCGDALQHVVLDLGCAPPSNAYLTADQRRSSETYFPLKIQVCENCWLVQTEDYTTAEDLFTPEYSYFSSTSTSWLDHANVYCERMILELDLTQNSLVLEIACNDGYLLKNFVAKEIPCLGIEPAKRTAEVAIKSGIPILQEFFGEHLGRRLADEGKLSDLIVGNNVYAHVPDINDFTAGLKQALKPRGVITLEFPHLMELLAGSQFDTVYHEHFSYLSLHVVDRIFFYHGLRIWNVEKLPTHGGSLRVFGCHNNDPRDTAPSVNDLMEQELAAGLCQKQTYDRLQPKAEKIKHSLLSFLIDQKILGKTVVGYGAAAKGNTLLNYAGVKVDLLSVVFDAAEAKQGKWMPGSQIPIQPPQLLYGMAPDYVLIFPWNIASEIKEQLSNSLPSTTKYLTAVSELKIL